MFGPPSETEYVEQSGSGYVIRVCLLQPGEGDNDPLRKAGYNSDTVLYSLFTGGEVYSDHDHHRLVRQAGIDNWVIGEFERLAGAVTPQTDGRDRRPIKSIVTDLKPDIGESDHEFVPASEIVDVALSNGWPDESTVRDRIGELRNRGHLYGDFGEYADMYAAS